MAEQHRRREYPRGESPFCTPRIGDVVAGNSGEIREVVAGGGDLSYVGFRPRGRRLAYSEITPQAWAAWCSRTRAALVGRDLAGYVMARARRDRGVGAGAEEKPEVVAISHGVT